MYTNFYANSNLYAYKFEVINFSKESSEPREYERYSNEKKSNNILNYKIL